jgi:anti-sigma factor RsiW
MSEKERTPHLEESILDRYVEMDLTVSERSDADVHLETCSSCRKTVAEYRSFLAELNGLPVPTPPPGFAARVLEAVLPQPNENALLIRFATKAYVGLAVGLAAVAAGVLGTAGPGPVAGTVASGFSRILGEALTSAQSLLVWFVDMIKAMVGLAPLARVMGSLAHGLETAAIALAPQYLTATALTLLLATLVLVWATTARERGVPHVSLSL